MQMRIETQRLLIRDYTMDDVKDLHDILGDWFFHQKFWRQGYAFESCRAVIDYAFHELDAHKIFAESIDSIKSVGLMKKLGMQLEGVQRSHTKDDDGNWADLYLYGLFKNDRHVL